MLLAVQPLAVLCLDDPRDTPFISLSSSGSCRVNACAVMSDLREYPGT